MSASGPRTGPTACALVSRHCALWGWREGVPGGAAFRSCEGRPSLGALPPPAACPQGGLLGSATHVLWAWVCRRGGPALSLWLACPAGSCLPQGWCVSAQGGRPSTVVRSVRHQALCLPPPARPLGRAARVPRPVVPGRGWCGRGDPAPASQRAVLRAVVARCGGGGRASPGGVPCAVVRGV